MSDSIDKPMPNRRHFIKLLGLAAASSSVAATAGFTQTRSRRPGAPPPPSSQPDVEISSDARDLMKIIKRRYGRHLDSTQLDSVAQEIEFRLRAGQQLRDVKLANHEEPEFTFRA